MGKYEVPVVYFRRKSPKSPYTPKSQDSATDEVNGHTAIVFGNKALLEAGVIQITLKAITWG